MHFSNQRNLLIIILLLVQLLPGCIPVDHAENQLASHGIYNIESPSDKIRSLNGEWEFYWNRLLKPVDFQSGNLPKMDGFFNLPGSWKNHHLGDKKLSRTGQATYRLHLVPQKLSGRMTLRLFDIHEAYKLWVDGRLAAQSGIPGTSAISEHPSRTLKFVEIHFKGKPIELILQVSNHNFRNGGITEPIKIAMPGPLEEEAITSWCFSIFFAGSLLMMGIYHLALFVLRKNNRAALYFSLYCFLVVGYCINSNTSMWVSSLFLPDIDPNILELISLSCFVIWASFIFRFLKTLYPDEIHSFLLYFLDLRILFFVLLLLFADRIILSWFIAFCLLQTFLYAVYYFARLIVCVKRKRVGAKILIVGLAGQLIAGINDPLLHAGIIKSIYLVEPAVFLFALSQSLVLAKHFSSAFSSVEKLSKELENKNTILQNEIHERNRLEAKLVNTSEEERRQLSYELHDSLCQQLTGARLRASALSHTNREKSDGPALLELETILKESTQEAYKIARGLCPVEHTASNLSLENLIATLSESTNINVELNKNLVCEDCSYPNLIQFYRIAQEALGNALRYSKADLITVDLECCGEGKLVLTVTDNGIGRKASTSHGGGLGTNIMSHRAALIKATLKVYDPSDGGTCVSCEAPCNIYQQTIKNNE
ncbi:7TM diverse intracellular signaling domain-containing protein [Maridesulfovibrio bastinii]|uniref:7TM diverse intracellular signaling domain-containing protein n=1 Tax=Maridesulfovibrio bastinii TaxID=47157 RepID=UPI0006848259|nr:7TM diverse intracellular signaling domain-containing protein [Maridesulfovibrio bastinii]